MDDISIEALEAAFAAVNHPWEKVAGAMLNKPKVTEKSIKRMIELINAVEIAGDRNVQIKEIQKNK